MFLYVSLCKLYVCWETFPLRKTPVWRFKFLIQMKKAQSKSCRLNNEIQIIICWTTFHRILLTINVHSYIPRVYIPRKLLTNWVGAGLKLSGSSSSDISGLNRMVIAASVLRALGTEMLIWTRSGSLFVYLIICRSFAITHNDWNCFCIEIMWKKVAFSHRHKIYI